MKRRFHTPVHERVSLPTCPEPGCRIREVYINHQLSGERTLLPGVKYQSAGSEKIWMQDMAGWLKHTGKGILINAITFQPSATPVRR